MDKNIPTNEEELRQKIEKTNEALAKVLAILLSQNEKLRLKAK